MARSLKIRKPRAAELRRCDELSCTDLHPQQQRRVQVLLLHAEGLCGVQIAAALQAHPRTIYRDLQAFARHGLSCLRPPAPGGARKRITPAQESEMLRLAQLEPLELGQCYGRWSLTTLRDYFIKACIVSRISREQVRRVLRKGGCVCAACNANCRAPIRNAWPF